MEKKSCLLTITNELNEVIDTIVLNNYFNCKKIFQNSNTLIFYAFNVDSIPVILKIPILSKSIQLSSQTQSRITLFAQQYELLKTLEKKNIPNVIHGNNKEKDHREILTSKNVHQYACQNYICIFIFIFMFHQFYIYFTLDSLF
jgi:hypothetical protein